MTLCIQASLSGDYQLPDDGVLVSGVYWLSLHPHVERFDKKVTIGIEHCASNFSSLFFITAKYTQKTLPYTFKPLPGGEFSKKESITQVNSFSSYAVVSLKGNIDDHVISRGKVYAFCAFYNPKQQLNKYEVHITVTKDLELHQKVLQL